MSEPKYSLEDECYARGVTDRIIDEMMKHPVGFASWDVVRQIIFDVLVDSDVNMLGEKGWTIAVVKCEICMHTWKAMYHSWIDELVCPHCNQLTDFEVITEILKK